MSATCGNVSCARREHLVAVLIKCALDLAPQIDIIQAMADISQEDKDSVRNIVERTYDAIEQLGIDVATGKEVSAQPSPESNLDEEMRRA